jgi:DNA-binding transcriptional LysR family regulator
MTSIRIDGRLKIPVLEGTLAAAVAGLGLVMTALGAAQQDFETGVLVRVLPDWDLGAVDMHAVFIGGRAAKPSARAFAAYLSEVL